MVLFKVSLKILQIGYLITKFFLNPCLHVPTYRVAFPIFTVLQSGHPAFKVTLFGRTVCIRRVCCNRGHLAALKYISSGKNTYKTLLSTLVITFEE